MMKTYNKLSLLVTLMIVTMLSMTLSSSNALRVKRLPTIPSKKDPSQLIEEKERGERMMKVGK